MPIWNLIQEQLSLLNEEVGEIALSMLSSMQQANERGMVDKTSEQFQEAILRFRIHAKWRKRFGQNFDHYHRTVQPEELSVF